MTHVSEVQPSAVDWRELRVISGELMQEAAQVGYASSCFKGYRLMAVRDGVRQREMQVRLSVERPDDVSVLPEVKWGKVTAPLMVTVNPL